MLNPFTACQVISMQSNTTSFLGLSYRVIGSEVGTVPVNASRGFLEKFIEPVILETINLAGRNGHQSLPT